MEEKLYRANYKRTKILVRQVSLSSQLDIEPNHAKFIVNIKEGEFNKSFKVLQESYPTSKAKALDRYTSYLNLVKQAGYKTLESLGISRGEVFKEVYFDYNSEGMIGNSGTLEQILIKNLL